MPVAPWVKDAARREAHQLPIEDLIRLTKGGSAVAGGIPSVEELCASRRTARGNSGGPCLGAVSSGNPVNAADQVSMNYSGKLYSKHSDALDS